MAHSVFINILMTGLPVVRQFSDSADFDALWEPLGQSLHDFLFTSNQLSSQLHIELSCKTVLMIKNQILNYRASYPVGFIEQIVKLVHKGQETQGRDEFSRQCFEVGAGLQSENDVEVSTKFLIWWNYVSFVKQ